MPTLEQYRRIFYQSALTLDSVEWDEKAHPRDDEGRWKNGRAAHHKRRAASMEHIKSLSGNDVTYRRSNSKRSAFFERDGKVVHQISSTDSLPSEKGAALEHLRAKAEKDFNDEDDAFQAKKEKSLEGKKESAKNKATMTALNDAMKKHGELISNAHKNRRLHFHSMTEEEYNSKQAISIHQSPGYGKKRGSSYKLVMIDGRPAYARNSDHWGEFHTTERGVDRKPTNMHQGDSYDERSGTHDKAHNWTLEGFKDKGRGQNHHQSGYVFLDELLKGTTKK